MFRKVAIYFFVLLLTSVCSFLHAQLPIFQMPTHQDVTVTDCKGEFHDSDAGPGNTYLAQAQDTFHICTGGIITMSFQQFQLENGFDTLYFYNGPIIDNNALIGKFTGSNTPTGIVANGCLTIFFKSSFALQDMGWEAIWTSTVIPPVPPTISFATSPLCNTTTIDILLNKKIHCDSVYASAFDITGPVQANVINAVATNCTQDSTTTLQLTLDQALNQNCNYTVDFTINMLDNCDSLWIFTVNNSFTIIDCPPTVTITATPNDTVCSGTCVQLKALLNSCLSYNYFWSHGLSNSPNQTVCPVTTTTYTLGVQSTSGGPIFNSSITITILDPQITPLPSDTVCQSDTPFNLIAFPTGGVWYGTGITDTLLGTFDPDTAMQGVHTIYYKANGCFDSIVITVLPMDAGFDEAACPNTADFLLSENIPIGGIWSGYNTTPTGMFTPDSVGIFTVTYTHPNGCNDFKQVYVQSLVVNPTIDTICQSDAKDTIQISPFGGRWTPATGITDTIYGILNPRIAGGGLHNFIYKLNGCMDTVRIYIKPIFAGYDRSYCPVQSPLQITSGSPVGGIWSSIGVNNNGSSGLTSPTGDFTPGIQNGNDFVDTLIYTAPNGCTDTLIAYTQQTNIIEDSLFFCLDDNPIELKWATTRNYPGGGVWTGMGVTQSGNTYSFNPAIAGIGIHTLTYSINTCSDTILMFVYPSQLSYNDTTICTITQPFVLDAIGINAHWQGTVVTNDLIGLFDPSVSGAGDFTVVYSTLKGCTDTITVTVYEFTPANIGGLNATYCYHNQDYAATLTPTGGTLTGTGITGNSFNPATAGEGQHQLIYSYGIGQCYTADTLTITVFPPLQTNITISDTNICRGGGSTITLTSTGGNPALTDYSYTWSHGLYPTSIITISPVTTTTYTITTSDGCSENKIDSVTIGVYPAFQPDISTSPIACNGTQGTATATINSSGTYTYQWSTSPTQTTSTMTGYSGSSYSLLITEISSGCTFDTSVAIPGYGIIKALFSVNPNLSCIPYEQGAITFIDLSQGATHGYWEFGDGTTEPYTPGQNPEHTFTEPRSYSMKLHVENIGNCINEYEMQVCVLPPVVIFIPDIFSPNGDGLNDVLYARINNISDFIFAVYDRWGEKVFETTDPTIGWDGQYKGKPAQQGIYMWYLNAKRADNSEIVEKGDVSLVR